MGRLDARARCPRPLSWAPTGAAVLVLMIICDRFWPSRNPPPLSPRLEALVVEASKRMISPNSGLISSLLLRRLRSATGDSFEYDDDRGKGSVGPADEARSGCVGGENFLGARDCGWGGHLVLSCIILHSTIISKTPIDIVERGIRFVGFTCTPTCVLWQDHSKYFMIHIGSSMIFTCKYL